MDLTAAQKRLVEADEETRRKERELISNPGDSQATIAYAVEYLRNNPELAQQAGINAFTPEDIETLKEGFNTLLDMLRWIDDRTDEYSFWEPFSEEFPVKIPSPGAAEPWEMGGWGRIDEVVEHAKAILNKTPKSRKSGTIWDNTTRI